MAISAGSQRGAISPTGIRRKRKSPRHLEIMQEMNRQGMATSNVAAGKEYQQAAAERAFDEKMAKQSLAMQQQSAADARSAARSQQRLGRYNTGINLLGTIFDIIG